MAYTPLDAWKLIYTLDFTAQTTQNLIGGGDFTIDGKTWTVSNQTAASTFSLTNGTGLIISPGNNTTTYKNNTRSCPIITTDMSQFVPSFSFAQTRALRITCRVTTTASIDAQYMGCGLEWAITPEQFHMAMLRGRSGSVDVVKGTIATSTTDTEFSTIASSDDTLACIWRPHWNVDYRSSTFSVTFPSNGGTYRGSMMSSMSSNVMHQDTVNSNGRFMLFAYPDTSTTGFISTFTHFGIYQLL